MADHSVESLKKKLELRKLELEKDLLRLSRETGGAGQAADPSDAASASTLEEVTISLQNTEWDEYDRICKALKMIEDGTYGVCSDCNQAISQKRLQLYPNATRCLVCQEAAEEKTT